MEAQDQPASTTRVRDEAHANAVHPACGLLPPWRWMLDDTKVDYSLLRLSAAATARRRPAGARRIQQSVLS
jgi:hypothetical protein